MTSSAWNSAVLRHRHRRHAWALRLLVVVHVIGIWVVGMAIHPGWLLAVGLIAAVGLAIVLADADARDGVQEMMAALPMRRWRQQLLTYLYGFTPLAVVSLIGGLAYAWELHQALWQPLGWTIYTTSPAPAAGLSVLAHLAVWGPMLVYTTVFGMTASFAHRGLGTGVALGTLLALGALVGLAVWLEYQRGLPVHGRYILLLWGCATAFVLALSVLRARQGDPMPAGAGFERAGGRRGLSGRARLILVIVLIAFLVLILIPSVMWVGQQPVSTSPIRSHTISPTPEEAP